MNYRSNGKLLITGEYVVLDGARAFALPTRFGNKMSVLPLNSFNKKIIWRSFDYKLKIWFSCVIDLNEMIILKCSNKKLAHQLFKIFKIILELNPNFYYQSNIDYKIDTFLEFDKNWGLGSSSTLVTNLANFVKVNPYKLLEKTFGGSGYDVACSKTNAPIFFIRFNNKNLIKKVVFNPVFSDKIYFVYLNKKQNSRLGIKKYKKIEKNEKLIKIISQISKEIVLIKKLSDFEELIIKHEKLISRHLNITTIKDIFFQDYKEGVIKSLGAWGGDFILVTSKNNPKKYFLKKGFPIIFSFKEMISF